MKTEITDLSKLVIKALRAIRKSDGCTMAALRTFITNNYNVNKKLSEKIPFAVRRGVAFGAIKKNRNNYKLDAIMTVAAMKKHAQPVKGIVEVRRRRRSRSRSGRRRRRGSRRRRRAN